MGKAQGHFSAKGFRMSRAYRISVKESQTQRIHGSDHVQTQLELLEILPAEAMAELLRTVLAQRGFQPGEDGTLTREQGNVRVVVDPCDGTVTVTSEREESITVESRQDATLFDDVGPSEASLREQLRQRLQQEIHQKSALEAQRLQTEASEQLESELDELQPELAQIVNQVTREALKQKAAQLGTIKEISEDPETGNLTIKLDV